MPISACGLLGVCHREGSLAVLSPFLVGDSARGYSIHLQKLEWLHHLSGLWSPLLCCKQIDNCNRTSLSGRTFPCVLKKSHSLDKLIIVVGFSILSKKPTMQASWHLLWCESRVAIVSLFGPQCCGPLLNRYCCTGHLALPTSHCSSNTVRCMRPSPFTRIDIVITQPSALLSLYQ